MVMDPNVLFLIGFAVAVFCSICCYRLAEQKGLSATTWAIIGFLAGLFGLLGVLIVPKNEQELERIALRYGSLKKCPQCAELVKGEALKCRYCGADLRPQYLRAGRGVSSLPGETKTAPSAESDEIKRLYGEK